MERRVWTRDKEKRGVVTVSSAAGVVLRLCRWVWAHHGCWNGRCRNRVGCRQRACHRVATVIKYLGGDLVQVVISYTNFANIWEITALSKISKSLPCKRMALGATTQLGKIWFQGIVC